MTRAIPTDWRERADRILERSATWDALIPPILLDSPVSRLGYWWGCSVGWVWGGLLSRGRIQRHGRLWVFSGMPSWAFGRGAVCVGNCVLTGDTPLTARVLRHEAVHATQWRRYGFLMPVLYLLAGRDPLRNRFEIEAGLEDGNYAPRG